MEEGDIYNGKELSVFAYSLRHVGDTNSLLSSSDSSSKHLLYDNGQSSNLFLFVSVKMGDLCILLVFWFVVDYFSCLYSDLLL